ncbi:hypothetical protein [Bacillus suaedae]|nr:hypothetical protein [Bacillus suaedae]
MGIMICMSKPQPSKEALDRFIEVYKRMVKEVEEKEVNKSN